MSGERGADSARTVSAVRDQKLGPTTATCSVNQATIQFVTHINKKWGTTEIVDSGEMFDRMNAVLATMDMQAKHVVIVAVDDFLTF
jgi:hypothetical protein